MANYPMHFSASGNSPSRIETEWLTTTSDGRELHCSIPKEFGGPNSGFSPEDFFILAIMNCYVATFKVIAANSKMSFVSLEAKGRVSIEQDPTAPTPWMKNAELKFIASGVENKERFLRLMERVSKQCMIINSVKTSVRFEFEVLET